MSKSIITPIRVRFYECDFYQHVNNAVYINYLDVSVEDFFRTIYSDIKNMNFLFHLVNVNADFKGAASFNDELVVNTQIKRIGNTSITFRQTIEKKGSGTVIVTAEKTGVFLNLKNGEKIKVPDEIVNFFEN